MIFAENESAIRGVPYLELITSCNLKPPRDTPNEFSQKIANQTPSMIVSIKLPVSAWVSFCVMANSLILQARALAPCQTCAGRSWRRHCAFPADAAPSSVPAGFHGAQWLQGSNSLRHPCGIAKLWTCDGAALPVVKASGWRVPSILFSNWHVCF